MEILSIIEDDRNDEVSENDKVDQNDVDDQIEMDREGEEITFVGYADV